MKKITYVCNICGTEFNHQKAVVDKQIKACYFVNYTELEVRELPQETDRHICNNCLSSILRNI